MKKSFILLFFTACSFALSAQSHTVSGKVTDASTNEAMLGVSVTVVGTSTGSITDADGNFSLSVPNNSMLRISYLGYKTVEYIITEPQKLDIALNVDSEVLDEVVLVGYAVQKKRDVLGAVSKVGSEELTKVPVASPQQALQGRIAGVQVSTQTGAPGSDISVYVRGVGSISSSNEPLYIVDGIPIETGLSNISPGDIENIVVLKEASSAAIYGSRATNGVVLITTKQGQAGDAKITYNSQLGFQSHGKLTKMATTDQYISIYNEAAEIDGRTLMSGSYLKDFADVNHLEKIFQVAPIQSHDLSISGGNEKTKYLLSFSYYDQEGIIKNTDYSRINFRSNITSDVKKWLQVGLNVSGSSSDSKKVSDSGDGYAGGGGSVVRYALFRNPAIPVYNTDGSFVDLPSGYYGNSMYDSFFGDGYSPEGLVEYTDITEKVKVLFVSGNTLIKLPANFFIRNTFGVDYSSTVDRTYNATWGTNDRINSTNSLDVSNTTNSSWTFNSTLNHSFSIDNLHNISWLIGVEAIKTRSEVLGGSESAYGEVVSLGTGTKEKNPYQSEESSALASFFGSANYNFNQKYYLSALIREDGSSKFSAKNRWGTFYSFSSGWNMESEDWMQSLKNISKLKLRAGYGVIGNQNISDNYARYDEYANGYYYAFGSSATNGYAMSKLGNEDLKWETSKQLNIGVDLELWKSTFGATIDYFYKVTEDMLFYEQLPLSSGLLVDGQWVNNGSVLNTGVDLELFYRKRFRNGGFDITWNGGFLHNEVLSLNNVMQLGRVDTGVYVKYITIGQPVGAFYLYEVAGIFQDEVEVLTSAYQGSNIKPGDVKYVNQNNDNVIDENDRTYMGSAIPTFTTGLNLSGNYGSFDASIFFQGAFGQKIYSQVNQDIEGFYRGFNVTYQYYKEHWTGAGTSDTQPRASWSAKANNAKSGSSRFLEDGSYVRLKNIQFGYTIPDTKKYHIDKFRIYLAATNLFTITPYSGLDPEMTISQNAYGEGDGASGIDWGTYPVARSYTFGINLTF